MSDICIATLSLNALSISCTGYVVGSNERVADSDVQDSRTMYQTYEHHLVRAVGSVVQGSFHGPEVPRFSSGITPFNTATNAYFHLAIGYPDEVPSAELKDAETWEISAPRQMRGMNWLMYGGTTEELADQAASFGGKLSRRWLPSLGVKPSVDRPVSVDAKKARLALKTPTDGLVLPTNVTIPETTLTQLLAEAEKAHLKAYNEAFEVKGVDPGVKYMGTSAHNSAIYSCLATSAVSKELLEYSTTHEIEIRFNPETKQASAALAGSTSGGPAQDDIQEPLGDQAAIEAAYAAKDAYDAKLLGFTLRSELHITTAVEVAELTIRPPETTSSDLDFVNRAILDKWWAAYSVAVADLLAYVDTPEYKAITPQMIHDQSGSELDYDSWLAEQMKNTTFKAADMSDPSLWERFKTAAMNVAKKVGDYASKWSPTEWVTAGAGLVAVNEVRKSPDWFKWALIAGSVFLLLK